MKSIVRLVVRLDRACARLNDGLVAVAVVLAIVTGWVALAQRPEAAWQVTDIPAP
jgi:uncharacterized membrane protein HdeD (DUF308 family)